MGRDPHTLGLDVSRWTLTRIARACPWLDGYTPSGVWRVLAQLALTWQRARAVVHSPDPDYDAKLTAVASCRAVARANPNRIVTLYLDESTIERHPTLASAYSWAGHDQPQARRSLRGNTLTRIVATLDPRDGRVVYRRASRLAIDQLVAFYQDLVAAYPQAERFYVVQDNWPIHTHPDLLVALEPQQTPFPFYRPRSWPTDPHPRAQQRWGDLHLPIQLVPLPTYASWCNPIEKLWRKLKQDLVHLHRWADDLDELRRQIDHFLEHFAAGSDALLRYTGLVPN